MNLSTTTTDNLTEVLEKIIDFTDRRKKVLTRNIEEIHLSGFVPMDFDVSGFAELMTTAVFEHIRSKRLILYDSENIRFGKGGSFECVPVVDELAKDLLEVDEKKYLALQIKKLLENFANNKIATELLEQKQNIRIT